MDSQINVRPNPWPSTKEQPLFAALIAILLIGAIAWEVSAVAGKMKQYRSIGGAAPQITVVGSGKVRGIPDIALVTAGFTVQGDDVQTTQRDANQQMTKLVSALKDAGVDKEDIRTTQFSITPRRTYKPGEPSQISGYEARQSVEVRIRNLDAINKVLGVAGAAGATNIGQLRFTIDNPESLRAEARQSAIGEARQKAMVIAEQLGVRLGRTVGFQESGSGMPPVYARSIALEGIGGGGGEEPMIETGSTEITSSVNITYELE
ncbi:MAG: SIMPL domain-containing protein [bacterium]|nr:SIMPL domain-containing protein [bacterium]